MELRTYETIFVMDPQMDQSKIDTFVKKIEDMITGSGGEIIKRNYWGKKRLAYEIKRKQYGFYIYLLYRSNGKIIEPIEREFKLNESVLRYLTVKLNKAALRQLERELRRERAAAQPEKPAPEPEPEPEATGTAAAEESAAPVEEKQAAEKEAEPNVSEKEAEKTE